jgi:hypothetical protein
MSLISLALELAIHGSKPMILRTPYHLGQGQNQGQSDFN